MLNSIACRQEHFRSDWFKLWSERMGFMQSDGEHLHRKVWEWSVISQALWERGMLRRGRRGLGFACGTERIVSTFAGLGADIEATDLFAGETAEFWKGNDEYAVNRDALYRPEMINREDFDRRVTFYNADMNDLSKFERAAYDFIWSSCAVEHVGSIDKAATFLRGTLDLLKPGGVSVHTTELNIASLDTLYDDGNIVIFRDQDLRRIDRDMRYSGGCMEQLDLNPGTETHDVRFDIPPYDNGAHVKLLLCGQIVTSVALICRKF